METGIFGSITFFNADRGSYSAWMEKVAIDQRNRHLLLVSVVGDQGVLKGMAASLNNNGGTMEMKFSGVKVSKGEKFVMEGTACRGETTYSCGFVKLPYGKAHGMFVTKAAGFMPSVTEPHLWQDLTSPRFTTPLLRDWMPYITDELKSRKLLLPVACYRCESAILTATIDDLDAIVSDGIRAGKLAIGGFKNSEIERLSA